MSLSEKINQIQKEISQLSKDIQEGYKKQLKGLNDNKGSLEEYETLLKNIKREQDDVYSSLKSIGEILTDNNNELSKGEGYLRAALSSSRKLASIQQDLISIRKGEGSFDKRKIEDLKDQIKKNIDLLKLSIDKGNLNKADKEAAIDNLKEANKLHKALKGIEDTHKENNKQLGAAPQIAAGLEKAMAKIGLPNLGIADALDKTQRLGQEAASTNAKGFKPMSTFIKEVGINLKGVLSTANLIQFALGALLDALKSVDDGAGQMAKQMNMTYSDALALRKEFTGMANASMDVAVNTKGLQESYMAIGKSLGSNAVASEKTLVAFTKLRDQAGYTNEQLAELNKLSLVNGKSLEDNTKEILGGAQAYASRKGLIINEKEVLNDVVTASASLKLSLGGSSDALAKAAVQARSVGINLETAASMANQLLQFESSIENELSAELLLGKDLNFEKARQLALNNDIAGAAEEIAKQVGTSKDFAEMNAIQQEAIAKAAGLTKDQLAQSLMDREALAKLSDQEGADAKEKFNNLVKQVGMEEAKKRLGNEQLATQYAQQNVQERFAQAVEKLKEIFVNVANALMPVFDIFADVFKILGPIVGVLGTIIKYTLDWGKYLLIAVGAYKTLQFLGDSTYRTKILSNAAAKIGLITDNQAIASQKAQAMLSKESVATTQAANFYKNKTLGTTILTNIQEKLGLSTKQSGLLLTIKESAIKAKDFLLDKAKNALLYAGNILKGIGNMLGLAGIGIQKAGNRSSMMGLLSKAGEFVLGMFSAGAKAPFPFNLVLPFILGAVAGGIAASMIAKYSKGDDVFSRGTGGGGGYGQRMLMDKGAIIALNDSDNVIATTNPIKPVTKANDMYAQGTVTVANSTAPKPEPAPAPAFDNSGVERRLDKLLKNTVTVSRV